MPRSCEIDADENGALDADEIFDWVAGKDESVANELYSLLEDGKDGASGLVQFEEFCAAWDRMTAGDDAVPLDEVQAAVRMQSVAVLNL